MDDAIIKMIELCNLRNEATTSGAIDGYEREALFYASIAAAQAADRQAAALERIAAALEQIANR